MSHDHIMWQSMLFESEQVTKETNYDLVQICMPGNQGLQVIAFQEGMEKEEEEEKEEAASSDVVMVMVISWPPCCRF